MSLKSERRAGVVVGGLLIAMLLVLQGCPALVVAIYAAYNNDGDISVTAEIPRSAPDIFAAAKKRAESGVAFTGETYTVKSLDESNYSLSLEADDGSWGGKFVVVPTGDTTSQITAVGWDKKRPQDESEFLLLKAIENVCNDLNVKYRVIGRDTTVS